MKRILFIILVLVIALGLTTAGILYAQNQMYYSSEDIKAEVEKIDKGIQITVTSDAPEIVKELQANARWYRDSFKYSGSCCPRTFDEEGYGRYRGRNYPCGFGGSGYGRRCRGRW